MMNPNITKSIALITTLAGLATACTPRMDNLVNCQSGPKSAQKIQQNFNDGDAIRIETNIITRRGNTLVSSTDDEQIEVWKVDNGQTVFHDKWTRLTSGVVFTATLLTNDDGTSNRLRVEARCDY